jgi:hypothetical protein
MNATGFDSSGGSTVTTGKLASTPVDPPVSPKTNISVKAVDMYPDPDRRPHGFRLRNAVDIRRHDGTGVDDDASPVDANTRRVRGVTVVTDNMLETQGDINLNDRNEFKNVTVGGVVPGTDLTANWSNFYDRGDGGNDGELDDTFATSAGSWRPLELLSDVTTVVSVATGWNDTFGNALYNGTVSQAMSFPDVNVNQNAGADPLDTAFKPMLRPVLDVGGTNVAVDWVRIDGTVIKGSTNQTTNLNNIEASEIPIKISRRGFPVYCADPNGQQTAISAGENCAASGGIEVEFGRESQVAALTSVANRTYQVVGSRSDAGHSAGAIADDTTVNAVIVNGIIPSVSGQFYGGFPNFIRFKENWGSDDTITFKGSMVQTRFAHTGTGQYFQKSWEPGMRPGTNQGQWAWAYFLPPSRRWGYDVGLMYAPPSPLASRFETRDNVYTETYRELPVNDPYINLLRCARYDVSGSSTPVDSTASCS